MGKIKDVRDKMVSLFRTQRRRDKELLRKFSQDVSKKTLEDVSEYCEFVADGNVELASKMKLEVANILDNGKNAKELFSKKNIDGALVGGASLKSEFADITKS